MLENSRKDLGHFWSLDPRWNGMEPILTNWTAEGVMLNFAESGTVELILRTVISFIQLSIYGAIADLCKYLSRDPQSARKPAEN